MELRILSDTDLAKERLFEKQIQELESLIGQQIKVSIWKGLEPELLFENGDEFDIATKEKVFKLYNRIFANQQS
jgi:hypothetical protein